jgi:hypothetical protein
VLYTASGSTWTQFQAGFDGGGATSLSNDGSTALATCAGCDDGAGEAYVYSLTAAAPLPAPEPLELHVSPGAPIGGLRAHASAAHLSVAFRASVASLARVEVLRQETGVEVDGDCVAAAAGGGSPCKRLVPVYSDLRRAHAGANRLTLPAKAIPASGRYAVRVVLNRAGERRAGVAMKAFRARA